MFLRASRTRITRGRQSVMWIASATRVPPLASRPLKHRNPLRAGPLATSGNVGRCNDHADIDSERWHIRNCYELRVIHRRSWSAIRTLIRRDYAWTRAGDAVMSTNSIGLQRLGLQPRRPARSFEILKQNTLGRWPEAVREICVRVGTVLNGYRSSSAALGHDHAAGR